MRTCSRSGAVAFVSVSYFLQQVAVSPPPMMVVVPGSEPQHSELGNAAGVRPGNPESALLSSVLSPCPEGLETKYLRNLFPKPCSSWCLGPGSCCLLGPSRLMICSSKPAHLSSEALGRHFPAPEIHGPRKLSLCICRGSLGAPKGGVPFTPKKKVTSYPPTATATSRTQLIKDLYLQNFKGSRSPLPGWAVTRRGQDRITPSRKKYHCRSA